jgi:hypothetical protein
MWPLIILEKINCMYVLLPEKIHIIVLSFLHSLSLSIYTCLCVHLCVCV